MNVATKVKIKRRQLLFGSVIGVAGFVVVAALFMATPSAESLAACRKCGGGTCVQCSQQGGCACNAYCGNGCTEGTGVTGTCQGCDLPPEGCNCNNSASCDKPPTCEDTCPCTPQGKCSSLGPGWKQGWAPSDYRDACKDGFSCVGSYPDCSTCDGYKPCYREELNTAPEVPASAFICVGDLQTCTPLSSDPSNPSGIAPPGGEDVFIMVSTVTKPEGSRGLYYKVGFDSLPAEWAELNYMEVQNPLQTGVVYHVLGASGSLNYCTDDMACAGGGPCTPVHGYFLLNNPPTVENVQVVNTSALPCKTNSGDLSRWTGSLTNNADGVNNPLDIAVTVRDEDGWEEISTVYFHMAPPDPEYVQPFNCRDELKDYVSIDVWKDVMDANGWQSAVKMEIPEEYCTPNCTYESQGECDAVAGCTWDEGAANNFSPYGCAGCRRDWDELAFNLENPLYQFDQSCTYPSGEPTGCNSCFFQTTHPDYKVLNVEKSAVDSKTVTFTMRLEFYDTFPDGQYQMYAMARNSIGGSTIFSGGNNPGCTHLDPCRTTDPSWTWSFDFDPPAANVDDVYHKEGDAPDTMRFVFSASDIDGGAGLKRVYDRRYFIMRDGVGRLPENENNFFDINPDIPLGLGTFQWGPSTAGPYGGFQGGDVVHAQAFAEDHACNLSDSDYDYSTPRIGDEWILTEFNDVYGWVDLYDPIPSLDPIKSLSTYWVGGGGLSACSPSNFGGGRSSSQEPEWCSEDYDDENRKVNISGNDWYSTLQRLVQNSSWYRADESHQIVDTDAPDLTGEGDGVYRYIGGGTWNIAQGTKCRGRKIVFVPSGKTVHINPDFTLYNDESACLFVGEEGSKIVIRPGHNNTSPENTDVIYAAFVTDGEFEVPPDAIPPRYDQLKVIGFVFSEKATFRRDLVFEDNMQYPAEIVEYDPRYLSLLRDMIGSRRSVDFECGIVKGSPACSGWGD